MANDINQTNWSPTDSSNTATPPNGWPEGMNPAQVDDAARMMMGAIKRLWNENNPTLTSGGSANVQTLTNTVAHAAYVQGDTFCFLAGFTNTSATTLNVDTLGAKSIVQGATALVGGEIVSGSAVMVTYDGTNFQLLANSSGALSFTAITAATVNGGSAAGSTLTLRSTSNGSPSGDSTTLSGSTVTIRSPVGASTVNIGASGSSRGNLVVAGTSGAQTWRSAGTASGMITFPAGTVDFSGTGGTSQVVKQTSAGGIFTVAQLAASDLTGLAASATTDTTNASNISSGTLAVARGGTGASTFTAGSVVFAGVSGTYTQDNTNLFWDDTNNFLGVGYNVPAAALHAAVNISTTPRGILSDQYSADTSGARLQLRKSRTATIGNHTVVQANDTLGTILVSGSDGSAFANAVQLASVAEGTISSGVIPGRFTISTANSSGTLTERVRVDSSGNVSLKAGTDLILEGSSSGSITLKVPSAAGSNTVTLPAGTTDFSGTGGTSQVVKQTSSGGAFTVAQLASTDLSDTTARTSYTPTDQSGASLTFSGVSVQYERIGNSIHIYGTLTYPSTADGSNSAISLPVAVPNTDYADSAIGVCANNIGLGNNLVIKPIKGTSTATFINMANAARATNGGLSTIKILFNMTYPVA